ncbi:MAG: primosomal protein N', partial [Lachnospiraceae bacterium]
MREQKNLYADIVIDISHSRLDQSFQYRIPERLQEELEPGNVVLVPFGRGDHPKKGYVLRITDHAACAPEKIKDILQVETQLAGTESKLTALALWMRDRYGSTAVQALRTVLPFREQAPPKKKRQLVLTVSREKATGQLAVFRQKHQVARARLLEALIETPVLPMELVTGSLKVTPSVWRPMEEMGLLICETEQIYRMPAVLKELQSQMQQPSDPNESEQNTLHLNPSQQYAVDTICTNWEKQAGRYLLFGVTGSGKTAVYMELIAHALSRGEQAILLIPEISLTYQNVIRFYHRFGDRISILHSRLSQAERYDQFERARSGEVDVMIGPRSALFTPFQRLGIIIIDEEHEPSYKSETVPRYHAREVAQKRAELEGAQLVLGSATPSLEAYSQAKAGIYRLLSLPERAVGGSLPVVHTVDLRKELKTGNRSILSGLLQEKLTKVLEEHRQAMLFLNRRGYSGFVSCRSCGEVMRCPHCDVSLSLHRGGRLVCHYCGYETLTVRTCPKCGSPFIGGFRAGTQQIEEIVKKAFPQARILRMDADTTKGKDGHAEILRAFGKHEADILIGTQMIVKGHDFPGVTLVGILAADLSLHVSDYRAAERTFQLLTQAAGRAGRGLD